MVSVFRLINKAKQQRDIFVDKKLVQSISLLPLQQREPVSSCLLSHYSLKTTDTSLDKLYEEVYKRIPQNQVVRKHIMRIYQIYKF